MESRKYRYLQAGSTKGAIDLVTAHRHSIRDPTESYRGDFLFERGSRYASDDAKRTKCPTRLCSGPSKTGRPLNSTIRARNERPEATDKLGGIGRATPAPLQGR